MKQNQKQGEVNIMGLITFRYLPYWPLFVFMILLAVAGAWSYLKRSIPLYQANATLMVKDEKKGVNDSKMMDELNIYSASKIVENEIEVVRSRAIMNEVVRDLHLYAQVRERKEIKSVNAYRSSPITIEMENPDEITLTEDIPFHINTRKEVVIERKAYPLNQWVETPYGKLQFKPNANQKRKPKHPLSFSLYPVDKVTSDFLSMLQVSSASKLSTIINLSLKDESKKRAEDVLNKVLENYHAYSIREKNKLASNTLAFVNERLSYVESELDSMERAIQSFKSSRRVTDLSEQGRLYLKSVSEIDKQSADISVQMAVLDQIENYIVSKNNKAGILPSSLGLNDQVLAKMLQALREAEVKYSILIKNTPENNPTVVAVANEIENLRPGILENIRNQKNALRTSMGSLANTSQRYQSQLLTIPQKERELLDISRKQIIIGDVYNFLLHKREETALSYASTVPDSWIVNSAKTSQTPVSPKKAVIYLISIIAAIALSALFVTVKDMMSRKVLFRADIEEATKVPVAAEIFQAKSKNKLVHGQEKGAIMAEQFRQVRAAIGMYGRNTNIRKLLVTSSISSEGKSFVSYNLALSLALSGKKVLLLDLDLRNPKVSTMLGIGEEPGMAEFLEGEKDPEAIVHNVTSVHKNLYAISAGKEVTNPTELLLNNKISELFEVLEPAFDCMVVDTAPVAPVTDAYILSEFCDTTLFVVRHACTPKTMLQSLDVNNKINALKNMHIVFNGIRPRGVIRGKYGFGYGYGYEYVYKQRTRRGDPKTLKT